MIFLSGICCSVSDSSEGIIQEQELYMNILKKMVFLTAAFMLPAGSIFQPIQAAESDQGDSSFDELLQQDFIDTMESDYLTMHFTVRDYEKMGIEKPEAVLTEESYEYYASMRQEAVEMLDKLQQFDYEKLSERQQHDYDALVFAYEDQRDRASDADYAWLFLPGNNVILNLSTNFTEFIFYNEQDFADYLSLLKSVPAYLESAIEMTEKQASKGYFMSDSALDETLNSITDFTGKTDDNPIVTDFEKEADAASFLSDGAKTDYKTQVKTEVIQNILPVCRDIETRLEQLRGTGTETGYFDMNGGLSYYEKMLQNNASTSKNISEQFEELDDFLRDAIKNYLQQLSQKGAYGSVSMTDPDEVLSYLSSSYKKYGFPLISDVSYTADYLDPSSVSDNVLAYYVSSPVDDYHQNVMKINRDGVTDANTLYQTLAHEGFPGHLYQHVYYLETDPNLIRTVCSFSGYTEGWAMYAETEAMYWDVVSEIDADLMVSEIYLNYALSAAADICVNGLGKTEKDLEEYVSSLGLNADAAADLYDMALQYPAEYASYGYGLMRLVEMRQKAEEELQDSFSEKEFNEVILNNGPRTLDAVEKDVDEWISEITGKAPEALEKDQSERNYYLWAAGGCAVLFAGVLLAKTWSAQKNPFA